MAISAKVTFCAKSGEIYLTAFILILLGESQKGRDFMITTKLPLVFQGFEQKTISKGDRAGQSFMICKFLSNFDTLELMLFNDNLDLQSKVMKLEPFKNYDISLGIKQNSGNTSLSLLDINIK